MDGQGIEGDSSQANVGRRQLVITAQLFRAAANMRHIDEMFSWLASAIVQSFNVQVAQFWVLQATQRNQSYTQLRAMVCQDSSYPQQIFVNSSIAATMEGMLSSRKHFALHAASTAFPPYQATLIARYGLQYCVGYFLGGDTFLPPSLKGPSPEDIPTPLAVVALLLLRQAPPQSALSAIDLVLEQSMQVAGNRGLLLPATSTPDRSPLGASKPRPKPLEQQSPAYVLKLIPHRLENADLMTSSNPFGGSVVISDKRARRLYFAIDGRKNLDELCTIMNLDLKELSEVLRILLEQRRVQLYEPGGQLVEGL